MQVGCGHLSTIHHGMRIRDRKAATQKAVGRAVKLCILGIILQGGYFHGLNNLAYGVDIQHIRWCGVLQVKCGMRGDVGPACNVVGYLDRTLLGINHLHPRPVYQRTPDCSTKSPDYGPLPPGAPNWCKAPFDPEGLLSSLSSVGSCFIGLHFGHVLVHRKEHYSRIWHWFFPALGLLAVGLMLHILGMEFNKPLYSFSYLCFTGGAAGLVLTGFYLLVDVYGWRQPTVLLEWMGMHALLMYTLVACGVLPAALQGFYWGSPDNNLIAWIVVHGPWHYFQGFN
ncbi:hypothetical protein CY35_07G079900 [Sphagnum magellanicum]|uniref:Uncharacterized protein n=1 Tax=Sphagnum magellanicum TaxID=128215 RepID=A0ACB8HM65_9BRYO|nr:hypothetical protein CY35_07G079900 [Sphagnum magellanicum]